MYIWGDVRYQDAIDPKAVHHFHYCVIVRTTDFKQLDVEAWKPECNYST